jgi:predicted MPP superfamily phosphohydrolase
MYIGFRIISPTKFSKGKKRLFWIILMLLPPLLPLSFFLRFVFKGSVWIDLVGWVAYIIFGLFSFVIALLLLRDIINLLIYLIHRIRNFKLQAQQMRKKPFDPQRRQFIFNSVNLGIIGASAIMTGYGIHEARRKPILKNITIPINGLPKSFEGIRIAQISDLHVGPTIKRRFVQSAVEAANSLNADIIVCTGDLVDDFVDNIREDVLPIKDLSAPKGVYFVTGNHEYYVGAQPWIEEIDRFGLRVLVNDHHVIEYSSDKLVLAGVPDYSAAQFIPEHSSDPHKAQQNAPQKAIKILLAHQPRNIFSAAQAGYDLQISGHTHGGQYFPWSMLVTLGQPYVRGLHKHNNTWIYVNQGTGYWGPPVRLGVPSEITLFELTGNRIS